MKTFVTIGGPFLLSPEKGARTSVYLATSPEVEGISGKYFDKCKAVASNQESYDTQVAKRLWDVSEQMTQLGVPAAVAQAR
jgi:hypothetical protein